jgi:hypothetical protein
MEKEYLVKYMEELKEMDSIIKSNWKKIDELKKQVQVREQNDTLKAELSVVNQTRKASNRPPTFNIIR